MCVSPKWGADRKGDEKDDNDLLSQEPRALQAGKTEGHCGTVRNMRDAGALRDECGFAECVWLRWDERGAHNCPHRWVKCKEARGGCRGEVGGERERGAGSRCCAMGAWTTVCASILLCRNLKQMSYPVKKKKKKCVREIFKLRAQEEKKLKRG